MMKTNLESMQAIHNIAICAKKQAKYFGIAGNKDKRGITFQKVSITYANRGNIETAHKNPKWIQNMRIGCLKEGADTIRLGDLKGNRFSIALRFLKDDDKIGMNVKSI